MTQPAKPPLDVTYGETSTLRAMVMTDLTRDASGHYQRPATFDADALELPETTSSDAPITTAERARENRNMYGSPARSAGGTTWKDSDPGENSWKLTFDGNVQPTEAGRAAMQTLREAQGNGAVIWIERRMATDDKAEGGAAFISEGKLPVPTGDTPVTFSFTVNGKGRFWFDTAEAPEAG